MVRTGNRAPKRAQRLNIDPQAPSPQAIARAVSVLRKGGLVAFPTDTLYALGADSSNRFAVRRVFAAKGRSPANPIPLLVADLAMATRLVGGLPEPATRLAERFWPGQLTLVVPAPKGAPAMVTAGTGRIGLRVPDSPVAMALTRHLGRPVTGTSANRSGGTDPGDADEVLRQLDDHVDLILDGGPLPARSPSTVVDVTASPPVVLREGLISAEEILVFLGARFDERKVNRCDERAMKAIGIDRKI